MYLRSATCFGEKQFSFFLSSWFSFFTSFSQSKNILIPVSVFLCWCVRMQSFKDVLLQPESAQPQRKVCDNNAVAEEGSVPSILSEVKSKNEAPTTAGDTVLLAGDPSPPPSSQSTHGGGGGHRTGGGGGKPHVGKYKGKQKGKTSYHNIGGQQQQRNPHHLQAQPLFYSSWAGQWGPQIYYPPCPYPSQPSAQWKSATGQQQGLLGPPPRPQQQ
ncbi:hypothetical protein BVRB_5g098080 [Beta vulgaris subsp. vulgaris]|nr:hypothetical protein BVRB_5g098080 [Beta vulgaris subsp. vulgaris]